MTNRTQMVRLTPNGAIYRDPDDPRKKRVTLGGRIRCTDPLGGDAVDWQARAGPSANITRILGPSPFDWDESEQAVIGHTDGFRAERSRYEVRVDRNVGRWKPLALSSAQIAVNLDDKTAAVARTSPEGALASTYDKATNKWSHVFTATARGTYRMVQTFRILRPGHTFRRESVLHTKPWRPTQRPLVARPGVYRVHWKWGPMDRCVFNWKLMMHGADSVFDRVEFPDAETVVIYTMAVVLVPGQTIEADPTDNIDSHYAEDVDAGGTTDQGGFFTANKVAVGEAGGNEVRVAMEFDLSGFAGDETVDEVDFQVNCTTAAGSDTMNVGPYNSDGTGDPSADAGADPDEMFSRCNVVAGTANYIDGSTAFQSTGSKTLDLDAGGGSLSVITHVTGQLGAQFSLAMAMDQSISGDVALDDHDANDSPTLSVEYTESGGGGGGGGVAARARHLRHMGRAG